jgi:hypothetical protein
LADENVVVMEEYHFVVFYCEYAHGSCTFQREDQCDFFKAKTAPFGFGSSAVGFGEDLGGGLSKMHDLGFLAHTCLLICDIVEFDGSLIGEVVEQVKILLGYFALLLIPEDKIDPVTDILTDIVRFQLLPLRHYEIVGGGGPVRHLHVMHSFLLLGDAEVVVFDVDEKLRQVVELRGQFPNV